MGESREVTSVFDAMRAIEGGGFPVRRPFPTARLDALDPFLLLDEMGPVRWPPNEAIGAPDHPHRGFETVTYVLAGRMEHRDSAGHHGVLGPGDVQWMTAGGGVVHSEMPEASFMREGGLMHGFQLWVNLPARDKMVAPRYQEIPSDELPEARSDDGRVHVKVIAGEAMGKSAVIETRTPIAYLHYTIEPGGSVSQSLASAMSGFAYVVSGDVTVAGKKLSSGQVGRLGAGGSVMLSVADDAPSAASFLLLAGEPIGEPIARYGPFVMNTQEEIMRAIDDYRAGRMGTIAA